MASHRAANDASSCCNLTKLELTNLIGLLLCVGGFFQVLLPLLPDGCMRQIQRIWEALHVATLTYDALSDRIYPTGLWDSNVLWIVPRLLRSSEILRLSAVCLLISFFTVCLWLIKGKFILIGTVYAKKRVTEIPKNLPHAKIYSSSIFREDLSKKDFQASFTLANRNNCMYLAAILTAAPITHCTLTLDTLDHKDKSKCWQLQQTECCGILWDRTSVLHVRYISRYQGEMKDNFPLILMS